MRVFARARVRLPLRWILIGFAIAVLTIPAFFCGMRNARYHKPSEQPAPLRAPTKVEAATSHPLGH